MIIIFASSKFARKSLKVEYNGVNTKKISLSSSFLRRRCVFSVGKGVSHMEIHSAVRYIFNFLESLLSRTAAACCVYFSDCDRGRRAYERIICICRPKSHDSLHIYYLFHVTTTSTLLPKRWTRQYRYVVWSGGGRQKRYFLSKSKFSID